MNRKRTEDPAVVSYGLYLYFSSSRSFRLAATRCLSSSVIKRTSVAIWKWVQRYSKLVAAEDRLSRIKIHAVKKIVFAEETLLKVDGIEYWLWIAYEPKLNSCLMMLCICLEKEGRFSSYAANSSSS